MEGHKPPRWMQARERHHLRTFWNYKFYPIYWSIVCADAADSNETSTRDVFDAILHAATYQSNFFGPMWPSEGAWPCHRWGTRAVERVRDYKVTPKHPVLLLANEHDPVTSIENAYEIMEHSYPEGAVGLGIRAGYGHGSYSMKSPCIGRVIQAYIQEWTLPPDDMTPYDNATHYQATHYPLTPSFRLIVVLLKTIFSLHCEY